MIIMYPRPTLYVVLFSPAIVLMIMAVVVSFDGWLSDEWITFFLVLLACAVTGAECVRICLRRKNRRK